MSCFSPIHINLICHKSLILTLFTCNQVVVHTLCFYIINCPTPTISITQLLRYSSLHFSLLNHICFFCQNEVSSEGIIAIIIRSHDCCSLSNFVCKKIKLCLKFSPLSTYSLLSFSLFHLPPSLKFSFHLLFYCQVLLLLFYKRNLQLLALPLLLDGRGRILLALQSSIIQSVMSTLLQLPKHFLHRMAVSTYCMHHKSFV